MKSISIFMIAFFFCVVQSASAQLLQEDPDYSDNTQALAHSSSTTADITGQSGTGQGSTEQAMGTVEGEITLHKTSSAIEVFSGLNKVEVIANDSDGWVGSFPSISENLIEFQPAGRPVLHCPQQSLHKWYGPCKVEPNR